MFKSLTVLALAVGVCFNSVELEALTVLPAQESSGSAMGRSFAEGLVDGFEDGWRRSQDEQAEERAHQREMERLTREHELEMQKLSAIAQKSPYQDGYGTPSSKTGRARTKPVKGYTKKDGTRVNPYYKS